MNQTHLATGPARAGRTEETEEKGVQTVRDGRLLVNFVRATFDKDKDDLRVLTLNISFPLTSAHKGLLPPKVEEMWRVMQRGGVKRIDVTEIEDQIVEIASAPELKATFRATEVQIEKATLAEIEEKGSGEAQKVIRLSFDASMSLEPALGHWAQANYGALLWMRMQPQQARLPIH